MHMSLLAIVPAGADVEKTIEFRMQPYTDTWFDYYKIDGRWNWENIFDGLTLTGNGNVLPLGGFPPVYRREMGKRFYSVLSKDGQIVHKEMFNGMKYLKDEDWEQLFYDRFLKDLALDDQLVTVDYHN